MSGRSSLPEEEPPRRRGPAALTWLLSSLAGLLTLGFLALAVVVVVVVLL
jgi:hypothetical protein